MKESPFRVGDRVTVHTSQGGPQGLTVVEKFTHDGRCMVLADGSLWRADGKRQWSFRGSFYKGPTVEREAPGDADHIAKRRIVGRIRKFADTLSLETPLSATALRRILDAIEAEETATDKSPLPPGERVG